MNGYKRLLSTRVKNGAIKAEGVVFLCFSAVFLLFLGLNELGISLFPPISSNTYNVLFPSLYLSKITLQMEKLPLRRSSLSGSHFFNEFAMQSLLVHKQATGSS